MSTQAVASLQTEIARLKHELETMKVADQIPAAGATVTVADYLLERLAQLNVTVRPFSTIQIFLATQIASRRQCSASQATSISVRTPAI